MPPELTPRACYKVVTLQTRPLCGLLTAWNTTKYGNIYARETSQL